MQATESVTSETPTLHMEPAPAAPKKHVKPIVTCCGVFLPKGSLHHAPPAAMQTIEPQKIKEKEKATKPIVTCCGVFVPKGATTATIPPAAQEKIENESKTERKKFLGIPIGRKKVVDAV